MCKLIFVWSILAPQLTEGLFHQSLAEELERVDCRVEMSHQQWVEVEFPMRPMQFARRMERRSTLPTWVDQTPSHLLVRRIERVSIHGDVASEVDAALSVLVRTSSIPHITVNGKGFHADHLKQLTDSVRVRVLYLRGVPLPHTEIPALSHDGLTWLAVCHTHFSNPAISSLPESLEYLDATRTRINDDGLQEFLRLKNLKHLNLRRTPTTKAAIHRLREEMPWCKITWEPLKRT